MTYRELVERQLAVRHADLELGLSRSREQRIDENWMLITKKVVLKTEISFFRRPFAFIRQTAAASGLALFFLNFNTASSFAASQSISTKPPSASLPNRSSSASGLRIFS